MPLSSSELKKTKDWIEKIKNYSVDDIPPGMNLGKAAGGYYSTIQLIFSYVDTFGAHFKGTQSAENATEFIREYFSKVNPRYEDIAGILYSVFRHGIVHTSHPKPFVVNDTLYLGLVGGKDFERILDNKFVWKKGQGGDDQIYTHLYPQQPDPSHLVSKKYQRYHGPYMFPISIVQLYNDFKEAVGHYINDLRTDPALQNKAFDMMNKIQKSTKFSINGLGEVIEDNPSKGKGNRKYIKVTELEKL